MSALDADNIMRLYVQSIERSHALALAVIAAGAEGDPLAMLDIAADFLNAVDAVEEGDTEVYEAAKVALGSLVAANARADQAIRFAAQVEEECARLTGVLKEISFPGCAFYRSVFCAEREKLDGRGWCDPCIARSALTPIIHDLPNDGRES